MLTRTAAPRLLRAAALRRYSSTLPEFQSIIVNESARPRVAQITLNRPKALNALSSSLFHELNEALTYLQSSKACAAVVLTGSEKAFAAGADIKEMAGAQFADVYRDDFLAHWTQITRFRKPVIAAVQGYALGGGCELAMMCDIILAAPGAVFGQPEISLGVIPGAGGTQRLTHAIGKSRAMELVLTGSTFSAADAESWGLISRIVPDAAEGKGGVVEEALNVAEKIAKKGQLAVQAGKEAVNASYELSLEQGLHFERRLFHQLFASQDQKIGMKAFAEKKKPTWTDS